VTDSNRVGLLLAAFFAAGAVNTAYMPLWYADRGLTAAEIGLLLGASSMLRVAGTPLLGWLVDLAGRGRLAITLAALTAAAAALLLPGLPAMAPLLAATALLGLAASLLPALTDSLTLALSSARRLDYGRTRAWGSVSYMAATAVGGALLTRAGSSVAPAMVAAGYGAAAVFALLLPRIEPPPRRPGSSAGLFRNRAFMLTLLATALIQGSHAAYYSFAPLLWRGAGLNDTVIGLLIAEGIIAEIALFLWGRRLVEHLGPARLTALASAACLVRWTAMAFVTGWAGLALLQVLHAGTFACQHLSSMLVLRRLPPERAAMAQTVLAALGFSAPIAALVWLTGQLYGRFDGLVFLVMAGVGGAALLTVRRLALAASQPD
jgi:PPP family 3-phenylpropionic acid transporter